MISCHALCSQTKGLFRADTVYVRIQTQGFLFECRNVINFKNSYLTFFSFVIKHGKSETKEVSF